MYLTDDEVESSSGGYTLTVYSDQFATSPREWDNVGNFITWERDNTSPDRNVYDDPAEFLTEWTGYGQGGVCSNCEAEASFLREYVLDGFKFVECSDCSVSRVVVGFLGVKLPVYRYSHSSTSYQTSPYSCPWDSGWVGFIFATKDAIELAELESLDRAEEVLKNEVEEYSQYAQGNTWGFTLTLDDEIIEGYGDISGSEDKREFLTPLVESIGIDLLEGLDI